MNFYNKSKKKVKEIFSSSNEKNNISNTGSITQINTQGSSVTINGKTYKGNNLNIINNKVIIDGVEQDDILSGPTVEVMVNGNCGDITTENGVVKVSGNSKNIKTHNGAVTIDNNIQGDVKTHNGNVYAKGDIAGNCKTHNGNINSRS